MEKPLVSVIIPVFNRESYVEEAIYSILNQTIQDFEILVVDDCSTDQSYKKVNNIKDKRITLLKNDQHLGVSVSRNKAIARARGEYIAFMDSDDISSPNRIEKQVNLLKNHPEIQACGCWLQCFGVDNHIIKHLQGHSEIQAQLLLKNSMSLGASTVKRSAFEGILFDAEKLHVEDYDYWIKSAWICKFTNLQEVLYYYRTHARQVSSLYLNTQREQDVSLKMSLLRKIDPLEVTSNKDLIEKIFFSADILKIKEYEYFFHLLNKLEKSNFSNRVFDNKELKLILASLKRSFVFDIFFKNSRGLNKMDRRKIFKVLPISEKQYVLLLKARERFKLLKNRKK